MIETGIVGLIRDGTPGTPRLGVIPMLPDSFMFSNLSSCTALFVDRMSSIGS
jgi:hypothetical protein